MSSPFKTKEFKELDKLWKRNLAKSGFNDIERKDDRLKTDAQENILHLYTVDQFQIKEEYYRLAGQFLHEYKFKSELDRIVWSMHSQGISIRNIIRTLNAFGKTAYRDKIHAIIRRLVSEMKTNVKQR